MIYRVVTNTLTGCLCAEPLAGTQRASIGCVWTSTETYNCQVDCDGCSLGGVNASATYLGLNSTALNNGTSLGLGSSSTCTAIALGCGATATDNGIAIGTNLTACCDEVLIGDKVIITDNTVINGSDGGCSNVVAINATATASCQVVINDLIDVSNTALNVCSESNIYAKVCCDCIDVKGCTSAINIDTNKVDIGASVTGAACSVTIGANATSSACCSTAIGYCATANGRYGIAIGTSATSPYDGGIAIGTCSNADNYSIGSGYRSNAGRYSVAIGYAANALCYGVAIGYNAKTCCSYTNAIGYGVTADTGCQGDTFIGYGPKVFKFCGSSGYVYGNGNLLVGRILNCAAELPATNCDGILYFVP